jgi:hypothetical protein
MNQYVIRISCFPKALSRPEKLLVHVPVGRFSPVDNGEKNVRVGKMCQCPYISGSLRSRYALGRTQEEPENFGRISMIGYMNQGKTPHLGEMRTVGDCQSAFFGELCSAYGIKFPTSIPTGFGQKKTMGSRAV